MVYPPSMALLPQRGSAKKRTHIVAIDMGTRTTKAVYLQRRNNGFDLVGYTIQDAPSHEKSVSTELMAEHLKNIVEVLGAKTKQVALMVGVSDSLLRHAEVPFAPLPDMRLMLKFNTKSYLQQDLPDHVFDCHIFLLRNVKPGETVKANQKIRVLVGGARKQFLEYLQTAARDAGLTADQISPSLMGVANAFEMAEPDMFSKAVVALVDIGFKNSSISILLNGELALSRVVAIGGDKLTVGLAEALNTSYPEAEGIKIGMPEQVQSTMLPLLSPLGRELRASIDFFEHQQDKTVSHVFISGGSARSPFIVETLQSELMVPCKSWNPVSFLSMALPAQQVSELEQAAPQLAVATGGAVACF
jgi:type IV pilus assembly protein PilM